MLEPELELELVGDVLPDVTGEGEEGVAAVPYVCRMAWRAASAECGAVNACVCRKEGCNQPQSLACKVWH